MKRKSNLYSYKIWTFRVVLLIGLITLITQCVKAKEFDVQEFLSKTTLSIGAGYKFHEPVDYITGTDGNKYRSHPISARIELFYQFNPNIRVGISHHSQWLTGFPLNNDVELSKTEVFIDYQITLDQLF